SEPSFSTQRCALQAIGWPAGSLHISCRAGRQGKPRRKRWPNARNAPRSERCRISPAPSFSQRGGHPCFLLKPLPLGGGAFVHSHRPPVLLVQRAGGLTKPLGFAEVLRTFPSRKTA